MKKILIILIIGLSISFLNGQTHFTFTSNTGNNATVVIQTNTNPNIDGVLLSVGDEIGAFTPSGMCVGAVVWEGSNTAITVWGDNDQTGTVDGITNGTEIKYRFWSKTEQKEYSFVTAQYSQGSGLYLPDAIMVLSVLNGFGVPSKPALNTPSDQSTNIELNASLSWNALTTASSYRIQVSASNNFNSLLVNTTASNLSYQVQNGVLNYSTTYYWRVSGINNVGSGEWSEVWSFTTKAIPLPAVPNLSSPENNSLGILLENIEVSWNAAQYASTYKLEVSTDQNFTNLFNTQDNITSTKTSLPKLQKLTEYYWRVKSLNNSGESNWSTVWKFKTLGEPININLFSPENGSVNNSISLQFTWSQGEDQNKTISKYWFELNKDINTTAIVTDTNLTINSKAVASLENSTEYFWRVKAKNEAGWGEFTSWSSFTTIVDTPGVVQLTSPINETNTNQLPIELQWGSVTGAEQYEVIVSENADFSSIEFEKGDIIETTYTISEVYIQKKYYWKVRAKNVGGIGDWSEAWSFTITNNPPEEFALLSPMADESINTLTPILSWNKAKEVDQGDVVKYLLLLDTPEPGVIEIEVGEDTTYTITQELTDNTNYYWKVIAYDLHGGFAESEGGYQMFNINTSNLPPNEFRLITPTHKSVEVTTTPYFYWENTGDPNIDDIITYDLRYAKDTLLADPIVKNIESNEYTLTESLDDNSIYTWNVIARDNIGSLRISDTLIFVVNTILEPPSPFDTYEPLINSEDNTITFSWEKSFDNDPLDYAVYKLYVTLDTLSNEYEYSEEVGVDTTYTLENILESNLYFWFIEAVDTDGLVTRSEIGVFNIVSVNNENKNVPTEYSLMQNYPNPFNPSTTISYSIPNSDYVSLKIYDIIGNEITTLVNEQKESGNYQIQFNASNLSSGLYFYKIQAGSFNQVRKMLLIK